MIRVTILNLNMKKEGFKRNCRLVKPKPKQRECLSELSINNIDTRPQNKNKGPCQKLMFKPFDYLPTELHIYILEFLTPQELALKTQLVSKSWNQLSNTPLLWKALESKPIQLK